MRSHPLATLIFLGILASLSLILVLVGLWYIVLLLLVLVIFGVLLFTGGDLTKLTKPAEYKYDPDSKWRWIIAGIIIIVTLVGLIYLGFKVIKALSSKKNADFYLPRINKRFYR